MVKILLVEDDSNLREIYGARLEAEGYQIVSANDGEEALATAVRELPDLIISDVMMPKISGFDMLDILRSTPETKDVKVIVMTALSQDEDRKRGEELGADRYVVKSQVTLDDVVGMVHELLDDAPAPTAPQPSAAPAPSDTATTTPTADPVPTASVVPEPATDSPVVADTPSQDPQTPAIDDPAIASPVNDSTAPGDAPVSDQDVQDFVNSSPLMNGTPPQPQPPTDEQPPVS